MHTEQLRLEQGILNVVVIGKFELAIAENEFAEILYEAAKSCVTKVLIDGQRMTGRPGDFERFLYSDFVSRASLEVMKDYNIKLRFAYVLHEPLRDPERFGENVAVKRGMDVKVFENTDAAIQWLNE